MYSAKQLANMFVNRYIVIILIVRAGVRADMGVTLQSCDYGHDLDLTSLQSLVSDILMMISLTVK